MIVKVKVMSECLSDRNHFLLLHYFFIAVPLIHFIVLTGTKIKRQISICNRNVDQIKYDIRLCSKGLTSLVHPFQQSVL